VAALRAGDVVIERGFSWPGLGRLLVRAILQRDFSVVQAVVFLVVVAVVVTNPLANVLYGWLDPRIRYRS
jgi:peptide/nickel transport system permease protein